MNPSELKQWKNNNTVVYLVLILGFTHSISGFSQSKVFILHSFISKVCCFVSDMTLRWLLPHWMWVKKWSLLELSQRAPSKCSLSAGMTQKQVFSEQQLSMDQHKLSVRIGFLPLESDYQINEIGNTRDRYTNLYTKYVVGCLTFLTLTEDVTQSI